MRAFLTLWAALTFISSTHSQSISRQVIASTGNLSSAGVSSSTTGPSNLFTAETQNLILTQGFQQPPNAAIAVEIITLLPDCNDYNGGSIELIISGCSGTYDILWENGTPGAFLEDLIPGNYSVTVTSGECSFSETIELPLDQNCQGDLPNVITVNSDGANDIWIIPELFKPENAQNSVAIFNRWGQQVWKAESYNNTSVVWAGEHTSGDVLSAGTYFYNIEYGAETLTGFIELLR
ncbi:MAG: gliding motility-associated C-terminal domain-containing protein [Flavobacteriales bacterium]